LKIASSAALFVLTLAGGIVLGRLKKPLNQRLFNIHKFSALAAALFTALTLHNLPAPVRGEASMSALFSFAGILVVALFVSGGLLSLPKQGRRAALVVHRLAAAAALVVMVILLWKLSLVY